MSTNPYASPGAPLPGDDAYANLPGPDYEEVRRVVRRPAICLMVVSALWIATMLAVLAFDGYLLSSGATEQMKRPSITMSKRRQVTIRMMAGAALLAVNVVIFAGAVRMAQLKNYRLAMTAAILAVIPCIGPCYLLGIPFGIWALVVLRDPVVWYAFR